jgi:hypothetical protein
MTSIIPSGCILVHDAVEAEGRELFPDTWTGEEGRERSRVLDALSTSLETPVFLVGTQFDKHGEVDEHRQAAAERLMAAYQSLCKKLEDEGRIAVVVEASGIKTRADPTIFRSTHVWKYLGTGTAPVTSSDPTRMGELYIEERAGLPEATGRRGGRPPKYDWITFDFELACIADLDSLPEPEDDAEWTALQKRMREWCVATWGDEPPDSTLRQRIADLRDYKMTRRGK